MLCVFVVQVEKEWIALKRRKTYRLSKPPSLDMKFESKITFSKMTPTNIIGKYDSTGLFSKPDKIIERVSHALYLAIPQPLMLYQNIVKLQTSTPAKEISDDWGNSWCMLEKSEQQFVYEALVECHPITYAPESFPRSRSQWMAPPEIYLRPEPGIECDSDAVESWARQVPRGKGISLIENAYCLVREIMHYEMQQEEHGAEYAATMLKGDCTEYAAFFAAILRYHNIAARLAGGYVHGSNLHAITEVFIAGIWVPIDITTYSEFTLGLRHNFIKVFHGNWMLGGPGLKGLKVAALYFPCGKGLHSDMKHTITVRAHTREDPVVTELSQKMSLDKKAKKVPFVRHPFVFVQPELVWHVTLEQKKRSYLISVHNDYDYPYMVTILLLVTRVVVEVHPLYVPAHDACHVEFSYKSLQNHAKNYKKPWFKILAIDQIGRGQELPSMELDTLVQDIEPKPEPCDTLVQDMEDEPDHTLPPP